MAPRLVDHAFVPRPVLPARCAAGAPSQMSPCMRFAQLRDEETLCSLTAGLEGLGGLRPVGRSCGPGSETAGTKWAPPSMRHLVCAIARSLLGDALHHSTSNSLRGFNVMTL